MPIGSKDVARAAIILSITPDRTTEHEKMKEFVAEGFRVAAVDFGGDYLKSIAKIVENAIVSAKRNGVIGETHTEEGAIAGATREALSQISVKAAGLSVGGKIGLARHEDHLAVAIFISIGLLHLNEVATALAHRTIC